MSASTVQGLVAEHLRRLREREATRLQESPEAQLADLIPELITGIAVTLNRPNVDLLGQAYERASPRATVPNAVSPVIMPRAWISA